MHLLIPFAACGDPASRQVLSGLRLPNLEKLVRRLTPLPLVRGADDAPSLPHERVLARASGLPGTDPMPWAALQAARVGQDFRGAGWAFVTPCHWRIDQAQVTLLDPQALALQEDESRALLAAMQPYFNEDGITLSFDQPTRWLARGELFRGLVTASLLRVIGHDVAPWMPPSSTLRRLQHEMQMLLYTHPVNDARAAHRALPVNSFWVSGSGTLDATPANAGEAPVTPQGLIGPALQQDWQRWGEAWQQIDASECAALLAALDDGAGTARLTLCSEQNALPCENSPRPAWARIRNILRRPSLADVWKQL
jgi:hypothetical protein